MKVFAVLFSILLCSFNVAAAEQVPSLDSPLLKIEMNVETDGVAKSIDQVNDSMKELIVTLEQIAINKNLTPQQTELVNKTVDNINQLTITSTDVVSALPKAINEAQNTLTNSSEQFYDELKFRIILIVCLLIVALLLILLALYWFIIRPVQQGITTATNNVAAMANTIQMTAHSLEQVNKTHIEILNRDQTQASLNHKIALDN